MKNQTIMNRAFLVMTLPQPVFTYDIRLVINSLSTMRI